MKRAELYCEGYHDRAFLAGWLEARGWIDPGATGKGRKRVFNPVTSKEVKAPRWAFTFEDAMFLEIIPAHGKESAIASACRTLKSSLTDETPPALLMIACDLDDEDVGSCRKRLQKRFADCQGPARQIETVPLIWHAFDDFGPGVPTGQTLERLVCGALSRVHRDRGKTVEEWLVATGSSNLSPKSYSWSHMAGWYATHGCEDFLRQVWREEPVRNELQSLLDKCGAKDLALELETP